MNEHTVNLRGTNYVKFSGRLDHAQESGLKSLVVEIVQLPTEENGRYAVCKAIAEFEDGRVFVDVGEAGPADPKPLPHSFLRIAATRAKARVLGAVLEDEESGEPAGSYERAAYPPRAAAPAAAGSAPGFCAWDGCGVELTTGQAEVSRRAYGKTLCPRHQQEARSQQSPVSERHGGAPIPTVDGERLGAAPGTTYPAGFRAPEGEFAPATGLERTRAMEAWSQVWCDAEQAGLKPDYLPVNITTEDLRARGRLLREQVAGVQKEVPA